MAISAINNNISSNMYSLISHLSSGKRINSAADDAAGLAISKKMESQVAGLRQGTNNLRNMDSFVRTADGALGSMARMNQDIGATYVRMNNGIYTQMEKDMLQRRIDDLAGSISGLAQQTRFNGIPVFSGEELWSLTGSEDVSMSVNIGQVSGDYSSMDATRTSLESLLSQIGDVGAAQNAIEHTIAANEIMEIESASSLSQMEDADMAQMITEFKKQSTLQQMAFSMIHRQNEVKQGVLKFLA